MALSSKQFFTPEQYFELEAKADYKNEYFEGQIFAMEGGSPDHSHITVNVTTSLNNDLRGTSCHVFNSDLRIAVKQKGFYTYPDVSVVCGELELAPKRTDTITNPKVIVEVLSPSTKKYDRSDKFELYRALPSFDTYILVDSKRVYVEVHQKGPENQWVMKQYENLSETFRIESLGIELALADIYEDASFIKQNDSISQEAQA